MADKYSFLVIKYPRADTAESALAVLKVLSDDKTVKLRDAVAITKNEKGRIKLHQTRDDSIGKGFVKGGAIGVLFAALFGPVGWIAMGAAAGGLFAGFDRGIKNKLLKELGGNMTPSESAVAILVEQADWESAVTRMKRHEFGGKLVVSEIVPEDIAEVERLLEDPKTVASVPEEMDVPAPVAEEAVPAAEGAEMAAGYDLSILDGVGPTYAEVLQRSGVTTFAQLGAMTPEEIEALLAGAGSPLIAGHHADTWPRQARLAAAQDWSGLRRYIASTKLATS